MLKTKCQNVIRVHIICFDYIILCIRKMYYVDWKIFVIYINEYVVNEHDFNFRKKNKHKRILTLNTKYKILITFCYF